MGRHLALHRLFRQDHSDHLEIASERARLRPACRTAKLIGPSVELMLQGQLRFELVHISRPQEQQER